AEPISEDDVRWPAPDKRRRGDRIMRHRMTVDEDRLAEPGALSGKKLAELVVIGTVVGGESLLGLGEGELALDDHPPFGDDTGNHAEARGDARARGAARGADDQRRVEFV